MAHHNLNLTALLGARICHDLISPVGAIGNGVELLGIAGDAGGSLTELISDSAGSANARLSLFRIAFGPVTDQVVAGKELDEITAGYFRDTGLSVLWPKGLAFTRAEAQLCLLMVLVLDSALSRRGRVEVLSPTRITGQSPRDPRLHPYWAQLCDNGKWPNSLSAGDVHFPLAQIALHAAGLEVKSWYDGREFGLDLSPASSLGAVTPAPFRRQPLGI